MIWASSAPCGNESSSTPGPLAAQPAQRLVHGDPRQPGREAGIASKALQMREGADIGFLHDVLGLAVVAQDAAGEPVQPAIIRLHDRANRSLVAGKRPPHQFGVAGAGESDLRYLGLAHDGFTNNRVLGLDAPRQKRFRKYLIRNMAAPGRGRPGNGAYGNCWINRLPPHRRRDHGLPAHRGNIVPSQVRIAAPGVTRAR